MVSLLVRFKFATEDRSDVADMLRVLTAETRKEPGCVSYAPHPLQEDPDTVLIYEQYRKKRWPLTANRPTSKSTPSPGSIRKCGSATSRIL